MSRMFTIGDKPMVTWNLIVGEWIWVCNFRIVTTYEVARASISVVFQECLAAATTALYHLRRVVVVLPAAPMSWDIRAWSIRIVKFYEGCTATTSAHDNRIWLSGFAYILPFSMLKFVTSNSSRNQEILRTIILLIFVFVMYEVFVSQWLAQHSLSHQPMLIYIALTVCLGMLRAKNTYITMGCNYLAAFPIMVKLPTLIHTNIIAASGGVGNE